MPTVTRLTTDEEWGAAVPIIRQLWSHEDEDFVRSWRDEDDYRLYGYYVRTSDGGVQNDDVAPGDVTEGDVDDDQILAGVAGISIQRVLHHRRHAWIHDIVVDEAHRSQGHGEALLAWIEGWAAERDCEYVALANVLDNEDGLSFYEDNGMERWGYVVETELD